MKKYIIILGSLILPTIASAHGMEDMAEDLSISHQIEELSPFTHFGEEHWFAGTILIILWLSLAYTVYSLIERFNKPKQ
ncbi:MAG: hypothetical protein A2846_02350 [Candidatus Doudnabacteria bacterium RIFCSPHIGHO2_01_FULL_49_9]|uniref:CcmD family protein n=1 Tax=Candidatus Doudnabacteria bacterium RIFCSPHIGHO2_01_FULL_49_9 TaxID=1817827 RepID=A0A1F5P3T1_9BACT|nr:MAG: hypothetical protein A2846_02350 [Candidatus Doudnabacteria bacterium RIFCSPHIGHO2_01_FULL_49_9]